MWLEPYRNISRPKKIFRQCRTKKLQYDLFEVEVKLITSSKRNSACSRRIVFFLRSHFILIMLLSLNTYSGPCSPTFKHPITHLNSYLGQKYCWPHTVHRLKTIIGRLDYSFKQLFRSNILFTTQYTPDKDDNRAFNLNTWSKMSVNMGLRQSESEQLHAYYPANRAVERLPASSPKIIDWFTKQISTPLWDDLLTG